MTASTSLPLSAYAVALPAAYAYGKRRLDARAIDARDLLGLAICVVSGAAEAVRDPIAAVALAAALVGVLSDVRDGVVYDAVAATALLAAGAVACASASVPACALGALVCSASLGGLAMASRGSIGWGDVKLAAVIGAGLGALSGVVALSLAFVAGGAYASALLIARRVERKTPIPFVPFLAIGAVGSQIVRALGY